MIRTSGLHYSGYMYIKLIQFHPLLRHSKTYYMQLDLFLSISISILLGRLERFLRGRGRDVYPFLPSEGMREGCKPTQKLCSFSTCKFLKLLRWRWALQGSKHQFDETAVHSYILVINLTCSIELSISPAVFILLLIIIRYH